MGFFRSLYFFFSIIQILLYNNVQALENEKIVGGSVAENCEFNYQVSLMTNGQHLCGGSILDKRHIITAAHCVLKDNVEEIIGLSLTVLAGTVDKAEPVSTAVTVDVDKIYLEKHHVPGTMLADIAVVRLMTPLNFSNECLGTIELPNDKLYMGHDAIVSGFGSISVTNKRVFGNINKTDIVPNDKLYFLKTKVIDNRVCQKKFLAYKQFFPEVPLVKINPKHICVESVESRLNPPRGTCSGDSGGPVVTNGNVLIGIVNVGPLNCDEFYAPGAHTRVSSYLKFIKKAIDDEDTCHSIASESVDICIISND